MKKLSIISVMLVLLCCLCSCGGNDVRYDAVYDTVTKQYIALGDTQEQVEAILGKGEKANTLYINYNGLNVQYYNSKAQTIFIDYKSEASQRYKYGEMDINLKEEQYHELYPEIEMVDFFSMGSNDNLVHEYQILFDYNEKGKLIRVEDNKDGDVIVNTWFDKQENISQVVMALK